MDRCARRRRSRCRRRGWRSIPPTRSCSPSTGATIACALPTSTTPGARAIQRRGNRSVDLRAAHRARARRAARCGVSRRPGARWWHFSTCRCSRATRCRGRRTSRCAPIPWPGNVLIYRSAVDSGYALDTAVPKAATIGELTFDFYSGPSGAGTRATSSMSRFTTARLPRSPTSNCSAAPMRSPSRTPTANGRSCSSATPNSLAPNQWKLTHLLRGQAGSEGAMRAPVAAGARVVVLDEALPQLVAHASISAISRFFYRWGPTGKDISDPAYQGTAQAFAGIGLRPLSPTGVRARWPTVAGDIALSGSGARASAAISGTAPTCPCRRKGSLRGRHPRRRERGAHAAASHADRYLCARRQTADFGGQQWSVSIAVYQLSAIFGRGVAARHTLLLTALPTPVRLSRRRHSATGGGQPGTDP